MKRANKYNGNLAGLIEEYQYQQELTGRLDSLSSEPFAQDVINEIVLWKVNRYARLSQKALDALNSVTNTLPKAHRTADTALALATLLGEDGVDLPMASTFLRFRNCKAFQIIDRHAYRAVYGEDYPLYSSSSDDSKINLYFGYLDKLLALAESKSVEFENLDRVLYLFDKKYNGKL
jgi:thermostable 8-oxoguanine DNA glycosylase